MTFIIMIRVLGTVVVVFLVSETFGIRDFDIYEYVLSSGIGESVHVPQDIVIISKGSFNF